MPMQLLIADDALDIAEVVTFGAHMAWPDCIVHTATSGQAALDQFTVEPVDLVVLDVAMPSPDGFEVCRRIRAVSQVPILMLTVRDATVDKVRALELGADDYLTKPFDHLELLARLRALVRRSLSFAMAPLHQPNALPGQSQTQSSGLGVGPFVVEDFSLDFRTQQVRMGGKRIPLTGTEYRLLEELVRNAGTVLSHRQLLERVWGPQYVGELHYLNVFVQRLRKKLQDSPQQARYIYTEWGQGYRFVRPAMRDIDIRGDDIRCDARRLVTHPSSPSHSSQRLHPLPSRRQHGDQRAMPFGSARLGRTDEARACGVRW